MRKETKRKRLESVNAQLTTERSSFMSHWKEIADVVFPRRARFNVNEANRGDRKNRNIVDGTATMSARTLRSGMMGGVTSPARPWFRLSVPDKKLAEVTAVKTWLYEVGGRMSNVFLKSNLYQTLPVLYGDMGTFGTSALLIEEDLDNVIRFYAFPIGSYKIAANERGKVDVFVRDFKMTVRQIISKWGVKTGPGVDDYNWEIFSLKVKQAYLENHTEQWIDIRHVILPNPEFNPKKIESKFKRYESVYYECGSANETIGAKDADKYLSEKGYDYFPVLCPRWEVSAEDSYGTSCPGMDALGEARALQLMQKRKAQGVEKMVNPPMTAPSSLRTTKASTLPGDITYTDDSNSGGFRPTYQINPNVRELREDIQDFQQRIKKAFYEDLFLMLANDTRSGVTAREIDERHEEKLLALGPVLEQLNQDLLDPLIDITFSIMMSRSKDGQGQFYPNSLIPAPPEELTNVELKIEYISVMAQAQKLVGIGGVERFAQFAGQLAAYDQGVKDKINFEEMVDVYAEMTSVPPQLVRSDDDVAAMRQKQAQAQAQAQQMEMLKQGAGAAKDLSMTSLEGENALSMMLAQANAGKVA